MKRVFVFLFLLLFFPSLAIAQSRGVLWRGVDLSYVNELEGCGAAWYKGGRKMSPYKILNEAGANVVRLRLWHSPEWTEYSTLRDVKRSIRRARENNMRVLLDFHYSDDWAHPGKQIIPAAWKHLKDPKKIAEALRKYTYDTLMELHGEGLLPEYVQIGNETNTEMMMEEGYSDTHPIRWERNVHFLNAGILAVKQVMQKTKKHIGIMLHIAQPEYVEGFFDDALKAGLYDFDIIGLSYYPKWSEVPISLIEYAVKRLRYKYKKEVVIVETAYPWTLANGDTM
ncbi:MAG: glycoside hydrolase family 53 protein, partial [Parvibaculales bacterium]